MTSVADITPAVHVRRTFEGEDDAGRVVAFDVTIGRRIYPDGAVVFLDRETGWRRLRRRYRRPAINLPNPQLMDRMDRDIDLLQVVCRALTGDVG